LAQSRAPTCRMPGLLRHAARAARLESAPCAGEHMCGATPIAGSQAGDRTERQTGAPQRTASERSGGGRPAQRGPQAADTCYGCGAAVQAELPAAAGYVPADRAQAKRAHRQLGQLLCRRGWAQEAA